MPIVFSFDIESADSTDYNRIQSAFERLGWENLGGSSYRYPKLGTQPFAEDWFNHVIPALMLFRTYALKSKKKIKKFTLDVQASTGYLPDGTFGTAPKDSKKIKLYEPNSKQFGKKNLEKWLAEIKFPYETK